MAQMKEQIKTPGKELNKMEISNLQMQSSATYQMQNTGYQVAQRNHWVLQQHKKDPEGNESCIK